MTTLRRLIIIISLFCLALLAITFLALDNKYSKQYLINVTNQLLMQNMGCKIKVIGLTISWPLTIKVNSLSISDFKQEWLQAQGVSVQLLPWYYLLAKKIVIANFSAKTVKWQLPPILPETIVAKTNSSQQNNNKNKLVLRFIDLPRLVISDKVSVHLSKELKLSFTGDLKYEASILEFRSNVEFLNALSQLLTGTKVTTSGYFNVRDKLLNITEIALGTDLFMCGFSLIDFANRSINAGYDLTCKQLATMIPELTGAVDSKLNISGSLSQPLLTGKITTTDLVYKTHKFPNLNLTTKLTYDVDQQLGNFKIAAAQNELLLNSYFNNQDDLIKFTEITATQAGNNIVGNLNYVKSLHLLNGELNLKSDNFKALETLLAVPLSGEADLVFKLTASEHVQKIDISGDVNNLAIKDFQAAQLQLTATLKDAWGLKWQAAKFVLRNAKYRDSRLLKTINFAANFISDKTDFSLAIDAKSDNKLQLLVIGDALINLKDKSALNIIKIDGLYDKSQISARNIAVNYQDQTFEYNIPAIKLDRGTITAYGLLANGNINTKMLVKTLPLKLAHPDLPVTLKPALLNSEVHITGKLHCPEIIASTSISDINFIRQETSHLMLTAKYQDNNLQLTSWLKNSGSIYGKLHLTLPSQLSLLPYKFALDREQKLMANLSADLDIAPLAALFLSPVHLLSGRLKTDMKIKGELNNLQIFGTGYFQEGKYEHLLAGIKIKNINSVIEANKKQINLRAFTAYDDQKKIINATGQWTLNKENMPFKFTIISDGLHFLHHQYVQGAARADIKISGDVNRAQIKGVIEPTFLTITIPQQLQKDIAALNVTKIIAKQDINTPPPGNKFFDLHSIAAVGLDILITAKHKVFIRGWGVDAELGGKLKCTGKVNAPKVNGQLTTIRGRYQEFGRQLTIKVGNLMFYGPIAPDLNIVGQITEDNTEVRLILAGPLFAPEMFVESSPALPQDEALSMLLFGKQSAKISPMQGLQLADSLRKLSGHGEAIDMFKPARNLLKVDDIKVKSMSSDLRGTIFGIGKYLTDRLYIEIEQGVQAGSSKAKVEAEIKNNVSIESTFGKGSSTIGINWRRDY